MNRIELLSPAGNLEILKSAVDNGADAVYIGVGLFNARMNAGNFTMEELEEGCKYAHRRSSLVYLTLNTLVNDQELQEALSVASESYNRGIDAILVQDHGLAAALHKRFPNIPLHASTQMNIYSISDYEKLSQTGITRVVLPRELSLDEIRARVKAAAEYNISVEVFAHGAVCVSCSGLCLFSAMNKSGSRSGNRGLCAQPCRQEYALIADGREWKKGHLLSPKDRSVTGYIADLINAGVRSLKIEGRMRDKMYVTSSTRSYRKLIDAFYDGTLNDDLIKQVDNELLVNFNRGGKFTSQYLSGSNPDDLLSGEYVGKFGLKLGAVSSVDARKGNIVIACHKKGLPIPKKGDYISLRDRNKEVCSFPVGKVHEAPGSVTLKGLHPDMIKKLNKTESAYLMSHDFIGNRPYKRRTHIDISVDSSESGIIKASAKVINGIFKGVSAQTETDYDTEYKGKPLEVTRIEAQFRKTGDTPFEVDDFLFESEVAPACPISLINDLRRSLMEQLISEIDYESSHSAVEQYDMFGDANSHLGAYDSEQKGCVTTLYIFPAIRKINGDLRRDADMYCFSVYDIMVKSYREIIVEFIKTEESKLAVVLPDLIHDKLNDKIIDVLQLLKKELGERFAVVIDSDIYSDDSIYRDLDVKHYLSAGANIYNSASLNTGLERADGVFISYEVIPQDGVDMIKGKELAGKAIVLHSGGPIPWMQTDFCPIGNNRNKCRECYEHNSFIMRQGEGERDTTVLTRPADCSCTIWGEAKNTYSSSDVFMLTEYGTDIIQCFTEV